MYINMAGKERHSIDAVATVKKMQDRFDWLHIYEVNDHKMNNRPSYVFKSSTPMAKIALLMNQDHEENEVLNIPSAHNPSAFHPDEDAKHKYISDSDDDQKENKKQGKKQGQKRKGQTKKVASKGNVKKTKQGMGKGTGKASSHVQPSSSPSSSQAVQGQGTSTPTSSQAVQGQGTSTPTSSQAAQGQTGQSSPYSPQVPNAYEAENFNNEVPTVFLYHKSMHVCYLEKCRKEWNPRFMRHQHNMLFCMKTSRRYYNKQGKLVIPKLRTNAYFCFRSLDCLQLVHDSINYCDLNMGNYYFNQLMPENVTILKKKGYWEPILDNCK